MPDDAIERARRIGIQVAAELPDGTPPSLYIAVAGGASRGAMVAFAQRPTDEAFRAALHASDVDPPYGPIIAAFRAAMLDAAPSVSLGEVG